MTAERAKVLGYTHHAKMYGFQGYYYDGEEDTPNTFQAKYKLTDLIVEFMVYLDLTFEINEGFPILVGKNL